MTVNEIIKIIVGGVVFIVISFFIYYIFTIFITFLEGSVDEQIVTALHKKETEFIYYYCLGSLAFAVFLYPILEMPENYISIGLVFIAALTPAPTAVKFVRLSEIETSSQRKSYSILLHSIVLLAIWFNTFMYVFGFANFNKIITIIRKLIIIEQKDK